MAQSGAKGHVLGLGRVSRTIERWIEGKACATPNHRRPPCSHPSQYTHPSTPPTMRRTAAGRAVSPTNTSYSGISNYRTESYRPIKDATPLDPRLIARTHFEELSRYLASYLAKGLFILSHPEFPSLRLLSQNLQTRARLRDRSSPDSPDSSSRNSPRTFMMNSSVGRTTQILMKVRLAFVYAFI